MQDVILTFLSVWMRISAFQTIKKTENKEWPKQKRDKELFFNEKSYYKILMKLEESELQKFQSLIRQWVIKGTVCQTVCSE